ncbi:DUF2461 domain-containing protein [Ovoidimarina sediminis]|uniref:DUF2461 domain-containing protein n=1 Tax=Ovoidimarina sediminis TaxID=3079856 RepID=UPI0029146D1C|nr:DUF2461 domain-containing protein [Rhodophyticola sp. MJ-SS7]MDU8946634.1 DUF2461 domain-containing protein [Rhodophyticola sp. MJ-SS7]
MSGFDHFPEDTLPFLSDLKANNTRDWFHAGKPRYEAALREPGAAFAGAMAGALADLTGADHRAKIYRIHRDVRFSKDKTPYNAYLHISFAPDGAGEDPPMWFFGLWPEKLTLGCGVFAFAGPRLEAFRTAMAGPDGARLIALEADCTAAGLRLSDAHLKTVPRGYPRDHPHASALKRKGFSAWRDMASAGIVTEPGLVAACRDAFEGMLPVWRFLAEVPAR